MAATVFLGAALPMNERKDTVWQSPALARMFLNDVRGAIPGADEQLRVVQLLGQSLGRPVESFLDLGCGNGVLGAAILQVFPDALGVFVDFSREMIKSACGALGQGDARVYLELDYGAKGWAKPVEEFGPFDMIVSGFSIHHQPDDRKRELYGEIFDLLAPGGVFVNVEHVSPTSTSGRRLFDEHFIDSMYALERDQGGARSREQIAHEYHGRTDKEANILAPVEVQCDWLRQLGYADVDCHFKIYELAVFAGRRP